LAEHGVTRLVVVPSLLRALLHGNDDLAAKLPRLRLCVSSGEALMPDLAESFRRQLPHCRLLNLYGSSEVAADATWFEVTDELDERVPIGRPIDGVRVHVLDDALEAVPAGERGELYISGIALARGYHGEPGLTANRFLPCPEGPAGQLMYRTGDLARVRPDGLLDYLGRSDSQIKVRGLRIELGEIDAALLRFPGIRAAAVVVRETDIVDAHARAMSNRFGIDTRRLVAFVVTDESPLSVSALKAFLRNSLPEYMVPFTMVEVPDLPLTPSGKIDRLTLSERPISLR